MKILALALLIGKTTLSTAHHGIPSEMAAHLIEICLLKILLPVFWGVIVFSGICELTHPWFQRDLKHRPNWKTTAVMNFLPFPLFCQTLRVPKSLTKTQSFRTLQHKPKTIPWKLMFQLQECSDGFVFPTRKNRPPSVFRNVFVFWLPWVRRRQRWVFWVFHMLFRSFPVPKNMVWVLGFRMTSGKGWLIESLNYPYMKCLGSNLRTKISGKKTWVYPKNPNPSLEWY